MTRRIPFLVLFLLVGVVFTTGFASKKRVCPECLLEQRHYQREVEELDYALDRLRKIRLRYRAQMLAHFDEGTRWQFQDGGFSDARRAFRMADREQQAVQMIERRIRFLERRKREL